MNIGTRPCTTRQTGAAHPVPTPGNLHPPSTTTRYCFLRISKPSRWVVMPAGSWVTERDVIVEVDPVARIVTSGMDRTRIQTSRDVLVSTNSARFWCPGRVDSVSPLNRAF
jgi:hypothetical protein